MLPPQPSPDEADGLKKCGENGEIPGKGWERALEQRPEGRREGGHRLTAELLPAWP